MSASNVGVDAGILEQNLLKSFDRESVAKLLGKQLHEDEVREVKRIKISDEGLDNVNESKINSLEDKLKAEKAHRVHYEEKSRKLAKNLEKAENVIISLKKKMREGTVQYSSSKIEQMRSKMLLRIGDIEKDTIEMKGLVAAELKNITDIKTPLENVSKLVEYLQSELESRDEKIKGYEKKLAEGSNEPVNNNGGNIGEPTPPSQRDDVKDSSPEDASKKCKCTQDSNELKEILENNIQ